MYQLLRFALQKKSKRRRNMKKILAIALVVCMMMTFASFPASAATTNPKRVKIFTMGDSFTAGICEPNAYRYYIYENLIQDGGVFEFIGPATSADYRVTDFYNKHGGNGGAVIGYKDDVKWNGSGWSTNAWTVTTKKGTTIKYNGTRNSLYYRLFAGSDGTNNYAKTEYGSYVKDADVVVMYIGLNDYYSTGANGLTADLEHVKERYYTVVDRIYEINPNVSLYVCSLNVVDYLRGYDLKPGDAGYENSVFKFNDFVLNDVVATYKAKGYKIGSVDLNEPGFQMIVGVDNPSDDAHPNEKGNRKIGTQIYKAIKDEVLELNKQTSSTTYNPTRVTSISIDKTSANLMVGENLSLTANIAPSNTEIITKIFSSSDESVATVDTNTGRVTAVGEGTATIYATALDSMRPGATEIKAACEVTVTSHEYQKTGTSYLPVLNENFFASGAWTGNTSLIVNSSKAYKHTDSSSTSSVTTKTSFDLKESFSMSFRASLQGSQTKEVNATNKASSYVSLKAGNYELRVAVCGKVVSFYHNGSLVKEKEFNVPAYRQNDDVYTLTKYKGTVYVYRNNECLFTADVDEYETVEGKVTLTCKGGTFTVRDVKVNSIYGLQKIPATVVNNSTMAGKVFDGSLSSRHSFSSGKGAATEAWTDAANSFIIDLGAEYDVSQFNIYWGGHSSGVWGQTMPDAYNVSYSADNTTYTPAAEYSGIHAYLKNGTATSIIDDTTYFFASHPSWTSGNDSATYSYGVVKETELDWTGVRYIKVQMTSVCYNPTIAEIEVFTKGLTEDEEPDGVTTFYKVNYVDKNGKVLAEQKLVKDMAVGTSVTETAVEIPGYEYDAQTKTIELKSAGNTITFLYTKIYTGDPVAAKITYLSKTGTYYLNSFTFEKMVDGDKTTAWVSDQYKGSQGNGTLGLVFEIEETSTLDSLTITWGNLGQWGYMMPNKYRVSVSEDNQNWKEIRAYDELYDQPTTYPGYGDTLVYTGSLGGATLGATVTATDLNVRNVRYIKIEILNWKCRPTIAEIEAVVIAGATDNVATSYTVKYVDENGNTLATDKSGTGYVGDTVNETAISISGYEPTEANKKIILGNNAETNVITFVYKELELATYTVKYVDKNGNTLADEKTGSAYVGHGVYETAKDIANYVPDEQNKTLVLTEGENVITFVYTSIEELDVATDATEALGANIRLETAELTAGLRFGAEVDKIKAGIIGEYVYSEDANVKLGMFLLPAEKLAEGETLVDYVNAGKEGVLDVPAKKIYAQDDQTITYTAVLVDIPEAAYQTEIVAVPYAVKNGKTVYFEQKQKSYAGVAKAAIDAHKAGTITLSQEQIDTLTAIVGDLPAEPTAAILSAVSCKGGYRDNNATKWGIANAIDGSLTTEFSSGQYNNAATAAPLNIVFELANPGTLDSLTIDWGSKSNWGHMMPRQYKVYVSSDNENYTLIREYEGLQNKPDYSAINGDSITYASSEGAGYLNGTVVSTGINAQNVRYIKLEILDWKYRPTIREISATVIC